MSGVRLGAPTFALLLIFATAVGGLVLGIQGGYSELIVPCSGLALGALGGAFVSVVAQRD